MKSFTLTFRAASESSAIYIDVWYRGKVIYVADSDESLIAITQMASDLLLIEGE